MVSERIKVKADLTQAEMELIEDVLERHGLEFRGTPDAVFCRWVTLMLEQLDRIT